MLRGSRWINGVKSMITNSLTGCLLGSSGSQGFEDSLRDKIWPALHSEGRRS